MITFIYRLIGVFVLCVFPVVVFAQENAVELNRARALGQAYFEEDEFARAIEQYEKAVELSPQSIADLINLGLAFYKNDRNEEAIASFEKAAGFDENNPQAHYLWGLALKKDGRSDEALPHFLTVAEQDESEPAALYNLGLAVFKSGDLDGAGEWFEKVTALDPLHSSAYYNLMQIAARQGEREKQRELAQTFQKLKNEEEQRAADAVDQCRYTLPISFAIPPDQRPRFSLDTPVKLERSDKWEKPVRQALSGEQFRILEVFQLPETELTRIVIATENETVSLNISKNKNSVMVKQLSQKHDWNGCVVGDYNNDGMPDLLLYSNYGVALLKSNSVGYLDESIALDAPEAKAVDAVWVDYDHEGDLDLLLAHPEGDRILQNNGAGGFTDVTSATGGLALEGNVALAASDFDNDNDIDIAALSAGGALKIFLNERESRFSASAVLATGAQASGSAKMIIRDIDQDGVMEIVLLHAASTSPTVYRLTAGRGLEAVAVLPETGSGGDTSWIDVFDANNDGYHDFLTRSGSDTWLTLNAHPVAPDEGEEVEGMIRSGFSADIDFDGDLDFIATLQDLDLAVYENKGGEKNQSIKIALTGEKNTKNGYGSKIEIKEGLFYGKQEAWKPMTHAGLGKRRRVDVLRLTWPNGIFQNVISATAGQVLSVTERPGYAGSCPFIYAWNGERFEFITDFLSTGPLGLFVGNGYFPPRQDETIRIRGDQLKPKGGRLQLRLTEELREVIYLDRIELFSVSHDPSVQYFANERFTVPPFPEFKLIGMSANARPPKRVSGADGKDRTALIAKEDHQYLRLFSPSRYDGVGDLHYFDIELDPQMKLDSAYLFLTGYLDWPNSSTVRHIAQNPEMDFVMPYLQVKNANGEWETVMNPMGFPAGKLKTIPIGISNVFLSEDRTLRIVSSLQVHWDRIMVDPTPVLDGYEIETYPLASAQLRYGGFSRDYLLDGDGPRWYDYQTKRGNEQWDYQTGNYTRYGNVFDLLTTFDDRYAIMATGDEIAVEFDAGGAADENRTYFFHATGWVKDADISTAHSQTVEPLPFKAMTAYPYSGDEGYPLSDENLDYLLNYNTRVIVSPNEGLR